MLKIFKQNTIGQILVIAVTIIALWTRAFIVPVAMPASHFFSPLYELVYSWLSPVPRLASGVALLLVLVQGVWINAILTNHKITKAHSLMPMFLYITVMSWNSSQLTITPMLLASLPLLAATSQLLSDGGTQLTTERNFNASFCIGLIGLFHLPALCYIVPFLFVFIIYKMYRWRHLLISILGLLATPILLLTYAFLSDKLDYYLILVRHDLSNIDFQWQPASFLEALPTFILLALLLAAVFKQLGSLNDRTVHQRINTGILCLPLIAAVILYLYPHTPTFDIQPLALPFAFVGTLLLMAQRKRLWINETLIILFIVCALINPIL